MNLFITELEPLANNCMGVKKLLQSILKVNDMGVRSPGGIWESFITNKIEFYIIQNKNI